MLVFTAKEISYLTAFLEHAYKKAEGDEVKQNGIEELRDKVLRLNTDDIQLSVTADTIREVNSVIGELENLVKRYASISDLGDIASYDLIKKQIGIRLLTLATYKLKFESERTYLEDYIKKEFRMKIVLDIMKTQKDPSGKSVSQTQADKLVEVDSRFIAVKKAVADVVKTADNVKIMYDYYSKMWQGVLQSVSTAVQDKKSIAMENLKS